MSLPSAELLAWMEALGSSAGAEQIPEKKCCGKLRKKMRTWNVYENVSYFRLYVILLYLRIGIEHRC